MRKLGLTALAVLIVSSFCQAATVQMPKGFTGKWQNIDSKTTSVDKLMIVPNPKGGYIIDAFGKCSPQDCEWGNSVLVILGNSVNDAWGQNGLAIWQPSFAVNMMTLKQVNANKIQASVYTVFHDGSKRSNYVMTSILKRVG